MKVIWCGNGWRNASKILATRLKEQMPESEFIWQDDSYPLSDQVKDVNILIPTMEIIDSNIMKAAPKLKLIQQFGVGLEGVDLNVANDLGIFVANAPGTNKKSTAEAAFYFMLALSKKAKIAGVNFQDRKLGIPVGIELAGKTLGIVGFGQSGIELAKRAKAFEMNILAIKRNIDSNSKHGVQIDFLGDKNDLDHLLKESDFISIHATLNPETKDLFRKREFTLMKRTSYIINVARGPIINKEALYNALKKGDIAGAGLDVFWNEPEDPKDPLFEQNVITLPHVAGSTKESHDRMITAMIKNFLLVSQGAAPLNMHVGKIK